MTAPALAKSIKGVRHYRDPSTKDLTPSITALLSHCDNGALVDRLVSWGVRIGVETSVENRASLKDFYLTGEGEKRVAQRLVRKSHVVRNYKADRGTATHALAERIMDGEIVDEAIAEEFFEGCWPYVAAFIDFVETQKPVLIWQERTVFNATLGVAGTADLFAHLPRLGNTLIDLKTSGKLKASYLVQVAGYALADTVATTDETGRLLEVQPMDRVDAATILWLRDDGWSLHPVEIDRLLVSNVLGAARVLSEFSLNPPPIPDPIASSGDTMTELNTPATRSDDPKTKGSKSEGGGLADGAHVDQLRERIIAIKTVDPTLLDSVRESFEIGDGAFWTGLTAATATSLSNELTRLEGFDGPQATNDNEAVALIAQAMPGAVVVQGEGAQLTNEMIDNPTTKARVLCETAELDEDQITKVVDGNRPWTYDKVRKLAEKLKLAHGEPVAHEPPPEPMAEVVELRPSDIVPVSKETLEVLVQALNAATQALTEAVAS